MSAPIPTLTVVCPACQAAYPVEAGITDAAARAALATCLRLWPAPLRAQVLRYLGLHRPREKALRMDRLARLLEELVAAVEEGTVTRHREARSAAIEAWGAGLTEVLKAADAGSLDLPLKGHGLLTQIVWERAGRVALKLAAAERPLHPSHRPAALSSATDDAPAPTPEHLDWASKRTGGQALARTLAEALKGRLEAAATHDPSIPNGASAHE